MKDGYTSAQGKRISMESIRLANESVIAVGNMKVNARGDQLGPGGVPIANRQKMVNDYYNLHTPVIDTTKLADSTPTVPTPNPVPRDTVPMAPPPPSLDPLIDEQDDIEVQKPEIRGKLADAVAKAAVVNQELLKPLKQQIKDRGPSRI